MLPPHPYVRRCEDSERSLSNSLRVLIIEDEWMISDFIEGILRGAGYTVSGMAHNVSSAYYEIGLHNYDAALLDIGLGTEHSPAIADLLKETGTPFAFVTGYDHAFAKRHADVPLLRKPFSPRQLSNLLERLMGHSPNRDRAAPTTSGISIF